QGGQQVTGRGGLRPGAEPGVGVAGVDQRDRQGQSGGGGVGGPDESGRGGGQLGGGRGGGLPARASAPAGCAAAQAGHVPVERGEQLGVGDPQFGAERGGQRRTGPA